MNLKDILRAVGLGAFVTWLTQVDSTQARGLRGDVTGDGRAVTGGESVREIEKPIEGFGATQSQQPVRTFAAEAAAFEFAPKFVSISADQVQSAEDLEAAFGNQTIPVKIKGTLPDDVVARLQSKSTEDRRELIYLNDNLICLNTVFASTYKDEIAGDQISVKITDLIAGDGTLKTVDTVNPVVALSFQLENGGYLTAAVGKLTAADLAFSSCKIDGVMLQKFSIIEARFYDSYNDQTRGNVANVVQVSIYKSNDNVPGGQVRVASVLMEAPSKIKHKVFPWSPRGSVPALYDIKKGSITPESTVKPTAKPTANPTTPAPYASTKSPVVSTQKPTGSKTDSPTLSAPTSTETTPTPTAPTISTVVGGTKGKDNNTANASTGGSDATGPVLGSFAAVGTLVAGAAYVHNKNKNKQDKNKQASQASDTQMVRAAATKLAQPKQQYTKAPAFLPNVESRSVPPVPVRPTTTTQSELVQDTTENTANKKGVDVEVPLGIVAKRRAEIEKKKNDNNP